MKLRLSGIGVLLIAAMVFVGCDNGNGSENGSDNGGTPDYSRTVSTEVLVIGAGAAGLNAGNRAIQLGKKVIIVEKNANVTSNASTAAGGGGANRAASVTDNAEFDRLNAGGRDLVTREWANDHRMLWLYVRNYVPATTWMQTSGVKPSEGSVSGPNIGPYGQAAFEKAIEDGGTGELMLNAKATWLIRENGVVVGAVVETPGETIRINAESTILAAGGYGNNTEMLSDYLRRVLYYGPADSCHGDGIALATSGYAPHIGAQWWLKDFGKVYPHGIQISDVPGLQQAVLASAGDQTLTGNQGYAAIYINSQGNRVLNEGPNGQSADNLAVLHVKKALLEQDDWTLYLLMDNATMFGGEKPGGSNYAGYRNSFRTFWNAEAVDAAIALNGGPPGYPVFAHGTLAEIETKTGIPAAAMQAAITSYNTAVTTRGVDNIGRNYGAHTSYTAAGFEVTGVDIAALTDTQIANKTINPDFLSPNNGGVTSQYFVVKQNPRFCSTLGGLKVNNWMQVLDENDAVIPGLYAAGEVIGGVHGTESMPGQNVGWAMTSGYLAGSSVAGERPWQNDTDMTYKVGPRTP